MTVKQVSNLDTNYLAPISQNVVNQMHTLLKAYWHSSFFETWLDQYPQVCESLNIYTAHYIRYHPNEFDFSVDNANDCAIFDADSGYQVTQLQLFNRINQYCLEYSLEPIDFTD